MFRLCANTGATALLDSSIPLPRLSPPPAVAMTMRRPDSGTVGDRNGRYSTAQPRRIHVAVTVEVAHGRNEIYNNMLLWERVAGVLRNGRGSQRRDRRPVDRRHQRGGRPHSGGRGSQQVYVHRDQQDRSWWRLPARVAEDSNYEDLGSDTVETLVAVALSDR